MLTAERARELLAYDPETGTLTWRVRMSPRAMPGSIAGSNASRGYRLVRVDGKRYSAHRLIWLIVKGEWPRGQIDHRDPLNAGDNRIECLREATGSQNCANQRRPRHNTSGFKGVTLRPSGKWQAKIVVRGRAINLGRFTTPEEAHAAYVAAARLHFGEFARGA